MKQLDNASKEVVKRYEFDFGQHDSGALLQAGPMQVIDVIARRGSEDGDDGALLLKLDLETGELLLKKKLDGKVFNGPSRWDFRKIDQRFCVGPDGCGWLFIDNRLTRIHPDGTVEKLQELKHTGQLFFIGDDLYIYNGGRDVFGGFAGVLRIKGVFAEM